MTYSIKNFVYVNKAYQLHYNLLELFYLDDDRLPQKHRMAVNLLREWNIPQWPHVYQSYQPHDRLHIAKWLYTALHT